MKIFTGQVIALKNEKTATVSVARVTVHPLYKKRLRRLKKYQVHDEIETKIGDKVSFIASKPYSKTKKWRIIK
ncbi:MAG: 30S ribosomal protein S17 [Patescibacteria group bacterium]